MPSSQSSMPCIVVSLPIAYCLPISQKFTVCVDLFATINIKKKSLLIIFPQCLTSYLVGLGFVKMQVLFLQPQWCFESSQQRWVSVMWVDTRLCSQFMCFFKIKRYK